MIAQGNVIGWFQGKMEFGPRALGNRSILADPSNPKMKEIINLKIKRRESFRPFAPVVLKGFQSEWFESNFENLYMSSVTQVKNNKQSTNLEKAVFNFAIKESKNRKIVRKWDNKYFVQLYLNRFRSIYNNINPKISTYNKDLLYKLKKNKISAKTLAFMTHQEMNPKIWKEMVADIFQRTYKQ